MPIGVDPGLSRGPHRRIDYTRNRLTIVASKDWLSPLGQGAASGHTSLQSISRAGSVNWTKVEVSWPTMVLLRGRVAVEDGTLGAQAGGGRRAPGELAAAIQDGPAV